MPPVSFVAFPCFIEITPFIWSESEWNGQKLRWVPDVVDGTYTLMNAYIR